MYGGMDGGMDGGGNGRLRFGNFEFDIVSGKLFREDRTVKIQPQPLRVLGVLLERAGEIVPREQLRTRVWGDATFVEFDQGLNYCIRQIRLALRDGASEPLYIETLPKQGYRFIGHVVAEATPPIVHEHMSRTPVDTIATGRHRWRWHLAVPMLVLAAAAWWTTAGRRTPPGRLRVTSVSKLTTYQGD